MNLLDFWDIDGAIMTEYGIDDI